MMQNPDRPNVVLICVDQWRGDALSVEGHAVVRTPHLDRLASRGVRFSRAYAATPSCIAARAAMMTGLSQERHGRVGYQDGVPWPYRRTLAGEFSRHGYQTRAVGKMHVYPERHHLGFEHLVLHDGYPPFGFRQGRAIEQVDDYSPWLRDKIGFDPGYFEHGLNGNAYNARPWDKPESLHPTNFVATHAIDFIRRRDPTRPFFLFMSFHRPHPPLDPPAWAFEQYLHAEMPDPPVGDWAGYFDPMHDPLRPDLAAGRLAPDVLQRARAGYYGHLTHIDLQINRFLEVMAQERLDNNTMVMFVSDHGDMLGDHHLYRKSLPYEGSARIPLMLCGAPVNIKPGTVCDRAVELRDVMPTLLDGAGLPVPDNLDGRSLLGLARNDPASVRAWRPWFHGEHTLGRHDGKPFLQQVHYLTDGREKYIWFSADGYEQLFDLVADPVESFNLAASPAHQQRVAKWRKRMAETLRDREEGLVSDGQLSPTDRPLEPTLAWLAEGRR